MTTKKADRKGVDLFDLEAVPEILMDFWNDHSAKREAEALQYQALVKSLIPRESLADEYHHRYLDGKLDFDVFDMAAETRHNILLAGGTGSGKSMVGRAYAAAHRVPFVSLEMSGAFDWGTAIGATRVGPDGLPFYQFGEASLVALVAGLWSIEECNFGSPRFTAACHGMLDARQSMYIPEIGRRIEKHPGCLVVSSYNPGYVGVQKLNEAFVNRFALPYDWDYDPEVEQSLIGQYSENLVTLIQRLRADENITPDIGTNLPVEFITFAVHPKGGWDVAAGALTRHFPEGEQLAVTELLRTYEAAISADLGIFDGDAEDTELEPTAEFDIDDED